MLKLEASGDVLTAVCFSDETVEPAPDKSPEETIPVLSEAHRQLEDYFEGRRKTFDLSLKLSGTPFERNVWDELANIPFGANVTYSGLAKKLGDVNKVRAVGRANGRNPLPIIIPCHRVIGADNKLTGYAGGIERKRWLLQHEDALLL